MEEVGIISQAGDKLMDVAIRRAVNVAQRLVDRHGMNPAQIAVAGYEPTGWRY